MKALVMTRAAALVMLAALVVVALVGRLPGVDGALAAAPARDFTVTSQPASQTVQRGQSVTYRISLAPVSGFTGQVSLSTGKAPSGTTLSLSPARVAVGPSTGTSTLTLSTTAAAAVGTQTFTLTAASGPTKRTLDLTVVVSAPASPSLTVGATPGTVTVAPGSTATYALSVSRLGGYTGPVSLATSGPLPAGVSATVSPASIPAGTTSPVAVTLTVRTSAATPGSTTPVTVTATGTAASPVIRSQVAPELVVDTNQSAKAFSLAATVSGALGPGIAPRPVELAVTNPNNQPLPVTNLGVTVTGTSDPRCGASEFTVRQYAGSYPVTVPARTEGTRLTTLGVPPSALPTVAMLNRAGNQDACKGVTVSLALTGSATNQ
ncbi:hypothetical protein KC207_12725 [Phycicoccus sp. BSK3Z-2]|uniref:Uncharacterized protein n=1 Tax=Phycicoccus avicenniae TaxID=2828860 RepID=A0A941D9R7_9MICO|nr:hypothetical protein [Phycicoccus avicenniae]MBR7744151.1 hypothetical protein [Phycicoccus avicenniae]